MKYLLNTTITILLCLISTSVFAQKRSLNFQVDRFEPMPAQGTNTLSVAKSDILPKGNMSAGLFMDYTSNTLQLTTGIGTRSVKLIESQLRGHLSLSLGVLDFFDLGFVLPVIATQSVNDLGSVGFPNKTANGGPLLGDVRVVPKFRILDPEGSGLGIAIIPTVGLATGNEVLNSDGGFKFEPRAVIDWRSESGYAASLNGAYLFRPQRVLADYVSDDVVRWGAGVEIPIGMPELKFLATGFGDIGLVDNQRDGLANPYEVDGAIQYTMNNWVMLGGGGLGINSGVGNPDFRVFASIGFTPTEKDSDEDGISDKKDACPTQAEDIDGFKDADGCPDLDNDNDGIEDKKDMCTDVAEDMDGFEDDDGCPEEDNDGDGIIDKDDKCPNEVGVKEKEGCPITDADEDGVLNENDKCPDAKEDQDGFEDEDGCPDVDNDKDKIFDIDDKCPNDAEDPDGFEDADGCPDLDNDKDGFPDTTDKCPNKPETINGNKDEDGCPDKGKSKVKITKTSIQILDSVYFATGKAVIKKKSFNILDQVASILKANPQITKMRVEGHTDDRGKDAANLTLSQKRAESVVKYLSEKGIKFDRLLATGFGETRPLKSNKKKAGRAFNRRVEFIILEVDGKKMMTKEVTIETKEVETK